MESEFYYFYAKQSQFQKSQVNASIFSKMVYENKSDWTLGKNKPNSKPIKPNLPDAQMSVNSILTKDYERNDIFAVSENKANSKPIKANFKVPQHRQSSGKRKRTSGWFGYVSAGTILMLHFGMATRNRGP
jgi:hypothetical protein